MVRDLYVRGLHPPAAVVRHHAPIGEAMFHVTIACAGLEKQTLSKRTRAAWRGA